jgi:hypothetical protein
MSTQPHSTSVPPELVVERLLDGRILSVTITDTTRTVVDRYVEFIKKEEDGWPRGSVGYMICDVSRSMAGFNTPYGRARMNELLTYRPDLTTYTAVIVAKGFMVQIARVALNSIRRGNVVTHMCFSQEEALTWLKKMMEKHQSTSE